MKFLIAIASLLNCFSSMKDDDKHKDQPTINLILIGAPGSGKGTQASLLANEYGICHLSTGDILRQETLNNTYISRLIKEKIDNGEFVDDILIHRLISKSIEGIECRRGFLLDGYPRTINQVERLERLLDKRKTPIDAVIELQIPNEPLFKRISGRLIHLPSGRTYHQELNPPKVDLTDDVTGESLTRREDDKPVILANRLIRHYQSIKSVIDYYIKYCDNFHRVDALESKQNIYAQLKNIIDEVITNKKIFISNQKFRDNKETK